MKKETKAYLVIGMILVLFASASFLSFTSIREMQGNARVVNYVGIVRGATQKLVKKELMGYPDDTQIGRLDSIIEELITGTGPNSLTVLPDEEYLRNMDQIRSHWAELKELIRLVRAGQDGTELFLSSEEYFDLVDRTVSSAEAYSESKVNASIRLLLYVNGVFLLVVFVGLVYYIRTAALKSKADALGVIAYMDTLTQMPNRASCERKVDELTRTPPQGNIAVMMFDMNNVKRVNEVLGHQGGDRVLADFARILKTVAAPLGFVCRYGGDEFLTIFTDSDEAAVVRCLDGVNEKIAAYNSLHANEIEQIGFVAGYHIDHMRNSSLEAMIIEADRNMYIHKREQEKRWKQ